jgi:hypothetical protein
MSTRAASDPALTGPSLLEHDQWAALFPERPAGSPEEVSRRMGELRFAQGADERLHFRMLAPAGWRWRPNEEAGSPPGLLASLVSDVAGTAEVAVLADEVRREVSPADWTLHRLEREGYLLWAQRQASTPIGTMADLLVRREAPGGAVIARANMAKDGQRIFTIACRAREEVYPRWAGDFCAVLASFRLSAPERAPLAEPLASYCHLYPAVVGFSYPASWTVGHESLGQATCDVRLDAVSGDPAAGTLLFSARAGVRPRRLAADALSALEAGGASFPERPELAACPPPKDFSEAWTASVAGTRAGRDIEARALVLVSPAATLLLASCGPARAASPVDWMVVERAFDIARHTVYAV